MLTRLSWSARAWAVLGLAMVLSLGVASVAVACDDCITVIDVPAWDEQVRVTDAEAWDEPISVEVPAWLEETTLDHPAEWVAPIAARTIPHHDLVTPAYTVVIAAHDDPYQAWVVSHIVDYQWVDTSHYVPLWVETSWDEYYQYWQTVWCWSDYIEDFYDCGYWAGAYRHHSSGYWDQQWVTSGYEQPVTIDTSHFETRYTHVPETSSWVAPVYDDWTETIAEVPGYWIPAYSEPMHVYHPATTRTDVVHHDAVTHTTTVRHIAVGHLQRLAAGSTESRQGAPPAAGGSGSSASIVTEPVRIPIVTTLSLVDRPAYTETQTIVDHPAWDEPQTVVDQPAYDEPVTVVDEPARIVTTVVVDTPAFTIAHHDLVTAATTVSRQVVDVPGHNIQRAYVDGHYEQIRFFVPAGHWSTEWVCTNGYTDNWEGEWHCTAGYYHDVWKDTSYWVEPPDYRTVTWIPGSYVTTTTYVNSGRWVPDNCGATEYWWCAAHWQSDAHYVYPSDVWVDPTYTTVTDQVPAVYRDWTEPVPAVTHTVTTEIPAVTHTATVHHDAVTHAVTVHHDAVTHAEAVAHATSVHDTTLSFDAIVAPSPDGTGSDDGLGEFAMLMGLVALANAGRLTSTRDLLRQSLAEWVATGRATPATALFLATEPSLSDADVDVRYAVLIGKADVSSTNAGRHLDGVDEGVDWGLDLPELNAIGVTETFRTAGDPGAPSSNDVPIIDLEWALEMAKIPGMLETLPVSMQSAVARARNGYVPGGFLDVYFNGPLPYIPAEQLRVDLRARLVEGMAAFHSALLDVFLLGGIIGGAEAALEGGDHFARAGLGFAFIDDPASRSRLADLAIQIGAAANMDPNDWRVKTIAAERLWDEQAANLPPGVKGTIESLANPTIAASAGAGWSAGVLSQKALAAGVTAGQAARLASAVDRVVTGLGDPALIAQNELFGVASRGALGMVRSRLINEELRTERINLGRISSRPGTYFGRPGAGPARSLAEIRELETSGELREMLRTAPGEAKFWTGGPVAKQAAEDGALASSATTLEALVGDRDVRLPIYNPDNPATVEAWIAASKAYAQAASGEIEVFAGPRTRPGSIWELEARELTHNPNVTRIVEVDAMTGSRTVIFSR